MNFEDVVARIASILNQLELPYMLVGSVASSVHGAPRSTQDLDVVIAPTREQLLALVRQFPQTEYYADEQQALQAFAVKSQFNILESATGWKIDFIVAEASDYGRTALSRRRCIEIAGTPVYFSSPEDVIIAKLRWAKRGGSERQLQDAAGILGVQGSALDMSYLDRWTRELGIEDLWRSLQDKNRC